MRIKFYEKSSVALTAMLIIFALNFHHLEAQTNTQNIYSTLNTETRTFVNRLNQLPQNFTFNQTLKRGTPVSPDVQHLKWILNSDTRTALTDNPNMTLTELTSAFGPITEAAVKKFQTLYRSEILDPQGITNATGIVGKGTRTKLNWLLNQSRGIAKSIDYNTVNNYAVGSNNNPSYNNNYVDFSYFNNQASNTGNNGSTDSVQNSTSTESSTIYSTTSLDTSTSANTTNNTSGGSNSNVSDSSSGALGALAIVGAAALLNGGAGAA